MPLERKSIGREAAISLAQTGWWKSVPARDAFAFQMQTVELCMDFSEFHRVAEDALGRPVWTHEFAFCDRLWVEFCGDAPAPSMRDILNLIPAQKRIVVEVSDADAK